MENTGEPIVIEHLGILVTTFCNLNCRDCADLIPKRKNEIYELDEIKKDLEIVLETVEKINEVLIIGGETLLYPYLTDLICFCKEQEKIKKIIITTNGTMLLPEKILDSVKKNSVIVRVSGYPESIAPKRKELILQLQDSNIEIDNLENMVWLSMGDKNKRNLSDDKLENIFQTCGMKNCVSLKQGKIYYCSRQMAADEEICYVKPAPFEVVSVRDNPNLKRDILSFYKLRFISTCDYCDGISIATKKRVPTAIQMLDKEEFLGLLEYYYMLKNVNMTNNFKDEINYVKEILAILSRNMTKLEGIQESSALLIEIKKTFASENYDIVNIQNKLLNLINRLSKDYTFKMCNTEDEKLKEKNVIFVSKEENKKSNLLISDTDIIEQATNKYPLNMFYYNYLYIRAKLEKIMENDIECAVCGLSYTQYGIIEKNMKKKCVNLSISGQDIPYSLLMADKAINMSNKIDTIIIPIAYYQGMYDISADSAPFHKYVNEIINIPIFGESRNYKNYIDEFNYLIFFDEIYDLKKTVEDRDRQYIDKLKNEEFFNEMYDMPRLGGLNFDFHELSETEKMESAKKTASLNERVVNDSAEKEVIKYLQAFINKYSDTNKKIVFFSPPMTRHLYKAYSPDLRERFYTNIVKLFEGISNIYFYDWSQTEEFDDEDFSDFEHLNEKGAVKLTNKLNKI